MNRIERLADEAMEDVLPEAPRLRRPRKLSSDKSEELQQLLETVTKDMGIDAWNRTTRFVQQLIAEEFDKEYSKRHVLDLPDEIGCTSKTARTADIKGDERARDAFKDGLRITDAPMERRDRRCHQPVSAPFENERRSRLV